MKAYDLWYDRGGEISTAPFGRGERRPLPVGVPQGWIGSAGPGIDPATWPRGPLSGWPMFHVITLWLPPEYRRRGPAYPGISFFQGEGDAVVPMDANATPPGADPFLRDVAAAVDHPMLQRCVDIIDGQFALIWLTEAELARGPVEPPADTRSGADHEGSDEGPNAWDIREPTVDVWLLERNDPQAGLAPNTRGVGGYREPYHLKPTPAWVDEVRARDHLGGTAFPVQALPEGLTPYYLEIAEVPGANFGGDGSAQIDLESGVFDWACG